MKKDGDIFSNTEQLKEGLSNTMDEMGVEDVFEELTRAGPGTSLNDDLRKFRWITTMVDHVVMELGPSMKDDLTELSGNAEWIITKLNNLEGAVLVMNRSLDEVDRRTINLSKEFKCFTDKLTKEISQEIQTTIAPLLEEKFDSLQTRMSSLETVMNDQHQVEGKSKKKQKQKKKPVKEQDTQKPAREKQPDKEQKDTQGLIGEKIMEIGDDSLGSKKGCDDDYANWSNAKKRRMRKLKVKRRNEENAKQAGEGNDKQPEKCIDHEQEVKQVQHEIENEQEVERELEKETKIKGEHVKAEEVKYQHEHDQEEVEKVVEHEQEVVLEQDVEHEKEVEHKEEVDHEQKLDNDQEEEREQEVEHKQEVKPDQEENHEQAIEKEQEVDGKNGVEQEQEVEPEYAVELEQEIEQKHGVEYEREVEKGQEVEDEQEIKDEQKVVHEQEMEHGQEVDRKVTKKELDKEPMVQNSAYNSLDNDAIDEKGNRKDQDEETFNEKEKIDCCSLFNLQTGQTKDDRRTHGRWQGVKYHLLDVLDDRGPVPFPASFTTFFALLLFACVYLALTVYACLPDNY